MSIRKFKLFFFSALIILPDIINADSPLTSTPFHDKYIDVDIVLNAEQTGIMNKEFAQYLHDKSNPIDVKAALINALGWGTAGQNNAEEYSGLIFGKQISEIDMVRTNGNDLFVIGYLMAMDDYFNVSKALTFLKQARLKNDESYTVALIEALVKAQKAMDKNFCKVWKYASKVFSNKDLEKEMREDAVKVIYDYMVLYKTYCK